MTLCGKQAAPLQLRVLLRDAPRNETAFQQKKKNVRFFLLCDTIACVRQNFKQVPREASGKGSLTWELSDFRHQGAPCQPYASPQEVRAECPTGSRKGIARPERLAAGDPRINSRLAPRPLSRLVAQPSPRLGLEYHTYDTSFLSRSGPRMCVAGCAALAVSTRTRYDYARVSPPLPPSFVQPRG